MKTDIEAEPIILKCKVGYHGRGELPQIQIKKKDWKSYFSKEIRDIKIIINKVEYYSNLPDSFFGTCKHLRTAYKDKSYKGPNKLITWLNGVNNVEIEVKEKYRLFEIKK